MKRDYTYEPKHLSPEDRAVVRHIQEHLDAGRLEEGMRLVRERMARRSMAGAEEWQFLSAGFLIDFGCDMRRQDLIEEGIQLLESNRNAIERIVGTYTIDYCLGNAMYSLYGLALQRGEISFKPENLQLLIEAKNHHWRSVQVIEGSGRRSGPQVYVNLGNTLDSSARVIEAIRCYDKALAIDPNFGMAHLNRAQALTTLNHISGTYSISLLLQQSSRRSAPRRPS